MDFATIAQAVRNWQERHRARCELESLTGRPGIRGNHMKLGGPAAS